jgi:hypothetical protein
MCVCCVWFWYRDWERNNVVYNWIWVSWYYDNCCMVSWIPNNGGTTRQVRDNHMFMPYGFFFLDWVKLLHATTTTTKKCANKFLLVTIIQINFLNEFQHMIILTTPHMAIKNNCLTMKNLWVPNQTLGINKLTPLQKTIIMPQFFFVFFFLNNNNLFIFYPFLKKNLWQNILCGDCQVAKIHHKKTELKGKWEKKECKRDK